MIWRWFWYFGRLHNCLAKLPLSLLAANVMPHCLDDIGRQGNSLVGKMQLQWYTQLKQHPHVPMARPPGLTGVCFSNVDWLRIWESQKLRLHGLLLDLGRVNTLSSSRGEITYNCLPVSGQLPNNGPVAMQTHFSASLVSHPINVGISIFAPFWVSKLVAVRRVLRKVWCKNPAWLFPR